MDTKTVCKYSCLQYINLVLLMSWLQTLITVDSNKDIPSSKKWRQKISILVVYACVFSICSVFIKTEVVFTTRGMNNEWNINSFQNSPHGIQQSYFNEFWIVWNSSEFCLFIYCVRMSVCVCVCVCVCLCVCECMYVFVNMCNVFVGCTMCVWGVWVCECVDRSGLMIK